MITSTEFAHLVAVPRSPAGYPDPREPVARPNRPRHRSGGPDAGDDATVLAVVVLAVPNGSYEEWLSKLTVGQAIDPSQFLPTATRPPTPGDVEPAGSLAAGRVRMDLDQMRVSVSERAVEFTHQEFLLLKVFMQNPGRVLSRQRLLELAWAYDEWVGAGRTVDVHVRRLRAKLETEGRWIVTVRGFGYRFDPPPAEVPATAHTA